MPHRPWRLSSLPEEAAHVLNQGAREIHGILDDIQRVLTKRISATPQLNFGTVGAQSAVERTVFVTGANQHLVPHVSPQTDLGNVNLVWSARIISANQVGVKVMNPTGAGIAVNTVTWSIVVA